MCVCGEVSLPSWPRWAPPQPFTSRELAHLPAPWNRTVLTQPGYTLPWRPHQWKQMQVVWLSGPHGRHLPLSPWRSPWGLRPSVGFSPQVGSNPGLPEYGTRSQTEAGGRTWPQVLWRARMAHGCSGGGVKQKGAATEAGLGTRTQHGETRRPRKRICPLVCLRPGNVTYNCGNESRPHLGGRQPQNFVEWRKCPPSWLFCARMHVCICQSARNFWSISPFASVDCLLRGSRTTSCVLTPRVGSEPEHMWWLLKGRQEGKEEKSRKEGKDGEAFCWPLSPFRKEGIGLFVRPQPVAASETSRKHGDFQPV